MTTAGGKTLGVVLAGGLSRRMGGREKALIPLAGRPMLVHVLARLRPQVDGLVLNANGDPARLAEAALGIPVIADTVEGYAGPLAGILAALDWAAETDGRIAWVASAATDGPFLPADLVSRLHAARAAEAADLGCARSAGRTHPVIGLWPVALRSALRAYLIEEAGRKIDAWTGRYRVANADYGTDPIDPFFNINTPEDLAKAERTYSDGR